MKFTKQTKMVFWWGLAIFLVLFLFWIFQVIRIRKAHSTFENYYAFRGCQKLLSKTDTEASCKTASGQTIKIVKDYRGWYLDGDLATCIKNFCF